MISMLCIDRSVPVFGKIEDGNASDKNLIPTLSGSMLPISNHEDKCHPSQVSGPP
jgi:hypothetical protein